MLHSYYPSVGYSDPYGTYRSRPGSSSTEQMQERFDSGFLINKKITTMAPMALKTKTHSRLTCRRRKVRCTRQQPCMYCTRTGRQCVFPETTKMTRQRKPTAREEFRNRLERLECMVKDIITNREDINEIENDSQATNVATVPTDASSQGM